MVVAKVGCCGRCCGGANWDKLRRGDNWDKVTMGLVPIGPAATPSATTHLRNNHMCGGVNIGASIKYYIGAFNIQLTEYNHNL